MSAVSSCSKAGQAGGGPTGEEDVYAGSLVSASETVEKDNKGFPQ